MNEVIVKDWKLVSGIENLEGSWITGEELGKHLGYSEPRKAIWKIYDRHKDKFINNIDASVVKLTTEAGVRETIIFSERGSLKIIRYSNTEVADKIYEEDFDEEKK